MFDFWQVFLQFLFRVTAGLAASMAVTDPRHVTSGFYRVHLWVIMGLNTLGALAVWSYAARLQSEPRTWWMVVFWVTVATAIAGYIGAVAWLYEGKKFGVVALWAIALLACGCGLLSATASGALSRPWAAQGLWTADWLTSAALLGTTLAGMFLGHWYLNTPGMKLEPLRRLVWLMGAAVAARIAVASLGLASVGFGWGLEGEPVKLMWPFIGLRWGAGLILPAILAWMTSKTLDVPNTQSATGILYAGVIVSFIGELTSQLLVLQRAGTP